MGKRFGIDIDGTVTSPTSLLPFINKDFQLQLTLNDITQYELTPFVPVSETEFYQWFLKNEPLIYRDSPIANGAKDVLNEWDKKNELIYISARGQNMYDVTEAWFKQYGIRFDHIELLGSHKKIEAAKQLNVDVFLEDRYENAVEICEECRIPVLLFDTPYNQGPIPNEVIRIYSWHEANTWVKKWMFNE